MKFLVVVFCGCLWEFREEGSWRYVVHVVLCDQSTFFTAFMEDGCDNQTDEPLLNV